MTPKAQQLEALLFVAGEAVSRRELLELLTVSAEELAELTAEVSAHVSQSGLTLVTAARDIELTTSPSVAEWLTQVSAAASGELSRAAAETLAVVAYAGPITRFEVDLIRGVDSRRTLRHLLRRGAIRKLPSRRRVRHHAVTEEFLKQLGVTSREELPNFSQLSGHERVKQLLNRPV